MTEADAHEVLGGLGLRVEPFGEAQAYAAGLLRAATGGGACRLAIAPAWRWVLVRS